MTVSGKKVFRSFAELREHFFPEQAKKEQQRAEVETILDEAKFDQLSHRRRLTLEQVEEMGKQS